LAFPKSPQIAQGQSAFIASVVFCEYIFELLWVETASGVIGHVIASVLGFEDPVEVYAEKWIGQQAGQVGYDKLKLMTYVASADNR
jgi:hypothetical protein